jgi:hypothetical protein
MVKKVCSRGRDGERVQANIRNFGVYSMLSRKTLF